MFNSYEIKNCENNNKQKDTLDHFQLKDTVFLFKFINKNGLSNRTTNRFLIN